MRRLDWGNWPAPRNVSALYGSWAARRLDAISRRVTTTRSASAARTSGPDVSGRGRRAATAMWRHLRARGIEPALVQIVLEWPSSRPTHNGLNRLVEPSTVLGLTREAASPAGRVAAD